MFLSPQQPQQRSTTNSQTTLLLILLLLLGFSAITFAVVSSKTQYFDTAVIALIRGFTSPGLTSVMKLITQLCNTNVIHILATVLAIGLYLWRRLKAESMLLITATLGSYVIMVLAKAIINRPRPHLDQLVTAFGPSFPSGHAMISLAFYGAITYLLLQQRPGKIMGKIITIFFSLVILSIGISRIYLGVHYPSDVLAGFILGGAWLTICATLISKTTGKI